MLVVSTLTAPSRTTETPVGAAVEPRDAGRSEALAERLQRCVAFNPPEWYAVSDHGPIVATFED